MGLIYTTPKFHPDVDTKIANEFMEAVWRSLDNRKFVWKG
jgi:hypothetical protein